MMATAQALPKKQDFQQQLDRTFTATAPDGHRFELCMVEFEDVLDSETQETFAMIFRAPVDVKPEQSLFRLSNDGIGDQDIFLVPIRSDEHGIYFEAVFNRLKKG